MWKLSIIIFSLSFVITIIGNCSAYDRADRNNDDDDDGTPDITRHFRNYEDNNQRYRSETKTLKDEDGESVDGLRYSKNRRKEIVNEESIGKWKNGGSVREAKPCDDDSLLPCPLNNAARRQKIAFNSAGKINGEEVNKRWSSSRLSAKYKQNNEKSSREIEEELKKNSEETRGDSRADDDRYLSAETNDRSNLDKMLEMSRSKFLEQSGNRANRDFSGSSAEKFDDSSRNFEKSSQESQEFGESSKNQFNIEIKRRNKLAYDFDKIGVSARLRYRDDFKLDPTEYNLENENIEYKVDEYERPRPRKRRPPQDHEFVPSRSINSFLPKIQDSVDARITTGSGSTGANYESTERLTTGWTTISGGTDRHQDHRRGLEEEFLGTSRPPTYSVTWSTEKYTETPPIFDRLFVPTLRPKVTGSRRVEGKKPHLNRDRIVGRESPRLKPTENAELKSLLKMQQFEGLSLSELLQRRNFTLEDLLKGNAEVLKILKSNKKEDSSAESIVGPRSKIFEAKKLIVEPVERRQADERKNESSKTNSSSNEISSNSNKTNNMQMMGDEQSVDSTEKMDSDEAEHIERKLNDNEKLSAIVKLTKANILRNPSTERTTGLPTVESQGPERFNISILPKDDSFEDDEIMEFSDFKMRKIESTTVKSEKTTKFDDSQSIDDPGSTLSIENILSPTELTKILLNDTKELDDTRHNTVKIDGKNTVSEMMDFLEYQSDEPQDNIPKDDRRNETISQAAEEELLLVDEPRETLAKTRGTEIMDGPKNHQIFPTKKPPYDVVSSEIEPDARAEIFELFSSGSSAKRLELLLKSRNMSIDELISMRQRGSSKVHLAEVSRLREQSRNLNIAGDKFTGKGIDDTTEKTTVDDLSDVEIDSASTSTRQHHRTPSVVDEETNISSINTEKTNFPTTTEKTIPSNPKLLELLKAFDSLPFTFREDSVTVKTILDDEERDVTTFGTHEETPKNLNFPANIVEIGLVEEILKNDSVEERDDNNSSNYPVNNNADKKNLSRVRPTIIASGAILGVTIVVFLAIFVVCRIRQKQKYTYRNAFSRAVFQGPVMTARKLSNSSSLNTIMVNVVATSTSKRPIERRENREIDENFEVKSDMENDSLDPNDSWETIPDFMK